MFLYFLNFFLDNNLSLSFFHNIIFRSISSFFTSFIIFLLIGPFFIHKAKNFQLNQPIRKNGPIIHLYKKNTPTMGGLLIILSIIFSIILWSNLSNTYIWYVLCILISYGTIGFVDDLLKINKKNSNGLIIRWKYFLLSIFSLSISIIIYNLENDKNTTKLIIPFLKDIHPTLGIITYIIFSYFTIISTSNAVNLTDGLDGLAIVPIILLSFTMFIISIISCNIYCIKFFNILYLKSAIELIVVSTSIIGSSIGFLWFNSYPAQIFMGDTGSLSLGGTLGLMSILLRQELLLIITGIIFVLETLSVIMQIFSVKILNKKIFLMTPLHHHFELLGHLESKIVIRFWIISLLSTFIGLITLIIYF